MFVKAVKIRNEETTIIPSSKVSHEKSIMLTLTTTIEPSSTAAERI